MVLRETLETTVDWMLELYGTIAIRNLQLEN